ncbi:MAG: ABC transporter ATP-binding protein [Firmicutes bacterium]|nr:ABC transporter ATP-binding protein [Bacillota bacterium]
MKSFSHLREFFRDNAWRYVVGIFWLIVVNIISLQFPRLLGEVTDLINMRQIGTADLLRYAGYIVAIAVAMAVGRFMWRIFIMGSARKVEYFLRNKLFAHFETLSANFFTEHKTGDLMAHATNDVRALRMTLGPGVLMLLDSIFMTVVTVYLMANTIDWKLTLLALLPMPFLAGLAGRLGKMIHGRFRAVQQSFSALTDRVQENLSGIRVIKSFVQEEAEIQRFDRAARDYVVKNMQMIKVWGLMGPMIQLISGISYLIVLGYGGIMVISAAITLGELVAFNTYLGMLVWPMMALGRVINVLQRGIASMERLGALLSAKPEVFDGPDCVEVSELKGEIEFRNLDFTYPNGTEALKGINIRLPRGKTLAIIGRTGSGKTTLVNLLVRLYNPKPGQLFIDGIDINRIPLKVLRENIGFVPQDNFLFSDTIANNIAFAGEFSQEEIEEAARLAQVYDNIVDFPNKFETMSGERGLTLSGGQKQRISIARALIKDPAILILDDCLSAVDTHTEEEILKGLRKVMQTRTSIIISHRVSTVKDADEIIVMDQGRIVERGTHQELIRRGGLYQHLYLKQQLEKKVAEA